MINKYRDYDKYEQDLKFWSNSCGELHHHGEFDIEEKDLPEELRQAYTNLWRETDVCLCYLCEFKGKYYIDLCYEYDEDKLAEDMGITVEEVNKRLMSKMRSLNVNPLFSKAEIVFGENCGIFTHELNVLIPTDTKQDIFETMVLFMEENYEI